MTRVLHQIINNCYECPKGQLAVLNNGRVENYCIITEKTLHKGKAIDLQNKPIPEWCPLPVKEE